MSIAQRLVNLSDGLSAEGILSAAKGGTGTTTGAGSSTPTISAIGYGGDDTATNPAGGATITLTGTNFASGAKVLINTTPVGVVTVVSPTQITFTAPQLAAGSYILYVVNLDGSTAIAVPGIQYSGTPAWSTAAGTLGTGYETSAVSSTVAATSDSAVTYSVVSGTLPSGVTINASGTISGTSPLVGGSTTYTFTVRATDAENQDTDRSFSLTINPDVVTWSSLNTIGLPQNVASTTTLAATSAAGQTVSYAVDTLPTGLTLSGATVSGTPTAAGATITTATATAAVTGKTAQQTITWTISIAADTYFPYTTLLLNSETTALPFLADASTNNFAITAVGDTKPNNFNPYTPGYYSNYFDGSGDYISTPSITAAGGDFTLEGWINGSSTQPQIYATAIHFNGVASTSYELWIQFNHSSNPGKIRFSVSTTVIVSSASQVANTWYHVAIVRSGSTVTCYIDGVNIGSTTYTAPLGGGALSVGQWPGSSATAYAGYVSNVRFVNGTALYTSNFTPATTPLTTVANTQLLTCQSNRLIDNSANAFVITKAGDVTVSSFDPFLPDASYATYGSTYFDGTGDYLSAPNLISASGDFTIECWFNTPTTLSGYRMLCGGGIDATASNYLAIYTSGVEAQFGSGSASITTAAFTFVPNTWYHVALTRSGTTVRMFVNGVSLTTSQGTQAATFAIRYIGNGYSGITYTGNISDFRVVNGTAVYTANFTPPATPLTAITNTALLTCQTNQPHTNSVFLDNSTNASPVTRTGNATQGSFSPYGANWSNYFNGSTDYLDINYTALQSYTGNATIECWFKLNAFPTGTSYNDSMYIIGSNPSASNPGIDFAVGSNAIWFSQATYPQRTLAGTWTPNLNWHHIAVTRNTNTWTMWLDGVSIATATSLDGFSTATIISIGRCEPTGGEATGYMNGYISNLRIVKGTALYTSAFTPSTQPLTAVSGTSLLTCQSASFVDNSPNASVITPKGTISTQKFNPFATVTQTPNTHSVGFDGSGDYLTVPSSSNLIFGTGDFCVEMWYYQQANAVAALFSNAVSSGGGDAQFELQIAASTFYPTVLAWNTTFLTSSVASTPNTWNHIAVCRNGTTLSMFLNGTRVATTTTSNNFSSTNAFHISRQAAAAAGYINGYISNLRVVKGSSVYTPSATTITVPTQPLTAIANTQLLTCQSSTLIDNSTNQFTITAFGDAKPRQQNPFGWTTSSAQDYSNSVFGSSAYFDGSGDYLNPTTASTAYNLTGDFTIEAWVYPTRLNANDWFSIDARASGATATAWIFGLTNSSGYKLRFYTGSDYYGTSVVPINAWTHIAWERNGSALSGYVNGVREYYNASFGTGAISPGSTAPRINSKDLNLGAGYDAQGYMSDIRLVNGSAIYKGPFVPPKVPIQAVPNTTLLLNMDCAGIQDKSGKAVLETVGDAKVSTSVRKYGSSSMYFDGTGDTLRIPASAQFQYTGDYTVEFWVYFNSVSTEVDIVGNYISNVGTDWMILKTANGTFQFYPSSANSYITGPTPVVNTWYHIAGVRSGTSLKLYVNGVSVGTPLTFSGTLGDATKPLYVGSRGSTTNFLNGYIDDLRISRYARYTANFTPPTSALLTK
jgi:hypothetical protein